jgi:hypothetical protein
LHSPSTGWINFDRLAGNLLFHFDPSLVNRGVLAMIWKSKTPCREVRSFEWVNRAMGNAVKCVHLNNVMSRKIAGRSVVIKSRNLFGRFILPLANWFFGAGGAAVSYWADPRDWQSCTTSTFEMLNPPFRSRGRERCGL